MLILLRNCIKDVESETPARIVKASHVEFFSDRIEFYNDVVEHSYITILKNGDFAYGETYDFCIIYNDEDAYILEDSFPNAYRDTV